MHLFIFNSLKIRLFIVVRFDIDFVDFNYHMFFNYFSHLLNVIILMIFANLFYWIIQIWDFYFIVLIN